METGLLAFTGQRLFRFADCIAFFDEGHFDVFLETSCSPPFALTLNTLNEEKQQNKAIL